MRWMRTLSIHHYISQENLMLQAVDLFCWGIFRKYEREDSAFYENYHKNRAILESVCNVLTYVLILTYKESKFSDDMHIQ